ncbi:hypothetical protein ACI65C_005523 [Semiaphis heraclei]
MNLVPRRYYSFCLSFFFFPLHVANHRVSGGRRAARTTVYLRPATCDRQPAPFSSHAPFVLHRLQFTSSDSALGRRKLHTFTAHSDDCPRLSRKKKTWETRAPRITNTKTVSEHNTVMSDDQQISIPANRPEDCPAEQSSMDYEVSFPLSPPIDETEMSSKDDDAASPASPQKEDVCLVPQSNNVADTESLSKENDSAASPPKEDANRASPPKEDANRASPPKEDANRASPPKEDANRASPLKEDANRASPPKEDVTPESPSKENVAPESPPKEVVAPESPPKEVVAPESPPKEDVAAAPPQMNDTNHTASRSSLPSNKNIASEPKVKTEVSKSYTYELTNSDYDRGFFTLFAMAEVLTNCIDIRCILVHCTQADQHKGSVQCVAKRELEDSCG